MKNSKSLISDEELLRQARECRSSSSFNELLRRYTYYAKALASQYAYNTLSTGIRKEEVEQVALISFYSSYKKIKLNCKSFYLYWETAAKREIRVYYAQNSYLEGGKTFAGQSLDEARFDDQDDSASLSDYIGLEDEAIEKEMLLNDLMMVISGNGSLLSEKEKAVLKLFLKNMTFAQIAKELQMSQSSVYLHFNAATKKLRKFLDKN